MFISRKKFLTSLATFGGAFWAGKSFFQGKSALFLPEIAHAATRDRGEHDRLTEVLKRGKVIVGTDAATPPFCYKDAQGKWAGFDIDLAHALAFGLFEDPEKVEFFDQLPASRIPNLQADKTDVVMQAMTVLIPRAAVVDFTIPYYRDAVNIVLPKDSPYNSITEIKGPDVSVAIMQNREAEDIVHMAMPETKVLQFETQSSSVLAVESGRAVAAAVEHAMAVHIAMQDPNRFKVGKDTWLPNNFAWALKKGQPSWLWFLNMVIDTLVTGYKFNDNPATEYTYQKIYQKHFGETLPVPQVGSPALYLGTKA